MAHGTKKERQASKINQTWLSWFCKAYTSAIEAKQVAEKDGEPVVLLVFPITDEDNHETCVVNYSSTSP